MNGITNSQLEPPLVNIQNHDKDLYHLSLVHIANGGAIKGFGMGKPFFEPLAENENLVGSGIIASISARPLGQPNPDGKTPEFTDSLDFITTQGVVGTGLALLALSRNIERSVLEQTPAHVTPVYKKIQELALSVVSVDTHARLQAQLNPSFMPDHTVKLELIPPKYPSQKDDTVDVPIYVNDRNELEIEPKKSNLEIGIIKFDTREQDMVGLPIDELFSRADWRIESARHAGYLLRIMTGSRVQQVNADEQALPDNVRQIVNGYGIQA